MRPLLFVLIAGLVGGCAASVPPVEVTRFHLGSQPDAGPISLQPAAGLAADSLEFRTYAAAVTREMARLGYRTAAEPRYRLVVGFARQSRSVAARPPVTIGVGGGSYGGSVGIGVGTSFGLGKTTRTIISTRLSAQMLRISDSAMVWEGRAETEAPENAPAAQPGLAADKLARALFQGFPGESGRTITVP